MFFLSIFLASCWAFSAHSSALAKLSLSIIESAIQKAVAKYVCSCEQTVVTDIHLQPDQASGQLNIYNDDDEELANIKIEEWATYEGDDFLENVEPSLRNILCRMKDAGDFDKVTILKPYSFVLVDEEKETVAELLLIDDDTILGQFDRTAAGGQTEKNIPGYKVYDFKLPDALLNRDNICIRLRPVRLPAGVSSFMPLRLANISIKYNK